MGEKRGFESTRKLLPRAIDVSLDEISRASFRFFSQREKEEARESFGQALLFWSIISMISRSPMDRSQAE